MDDFMPPSLGFKAALELYVFLAGREGELGGGAYRLYSALRAYLYERLSVEDMEAPEALLAALGEEGQARPASRGAEGR